MTLVALPLLPDLAIAWLGGLNPRRIWLFAILLASISFLGYLAMKLVGERPGALLAGALGGVVSSTAVTLANAAASRSGGRGPVLAAGSLAAGAVSCLRSLLLVGLVAPALGKAVAAPLLAAGVVMAFCAVLFAARYESADLSASLPANPFEIASVLRMAALLALIGLLARWSAEWLGETAVLLIAALSGLADVDAVTLSLPPLVPAMIAPPLAAQAVTLAVASNILAKGAYALALGGPGYGRTMAIGSAAAVLAGAAALLPLLR